MTAGDTLALTGADGKPNGYITTVVDIYPNSVWCVSQRPEVPGYTITHIPTTRRVAEFRNRQHAKRAAAALSQWLPRYRARGGDLDRKHAARVDWALFRVCRWLQDGTVTP